MLPVFAWRPLLLAMKPGEQVTAQQKNMRLAAGAFITGGIAAFISSFQEDILVVAAGEGFCSSFARRS